MANAGEFSDYNSERIVWKLICVCPGCQRNRSGPVFGNAVQFVLIQKTLLSYVSCYYQVSPITNYNVSDGQTYRYLSTDPLYPFGYGLSYSKFHYAHLVVSPTTVKPGQNVTVTVNVTNRGPYEADEV